MLGPLELRGEWYYCTPSGLIAADLADIGCLIDSPTPPSLIELHASNHRPTEPYSIEIEVGTRGKLRCRHEGMRWMNWFEPYPPIRLAVAELQAVDVHHFFAWATQ